MWMLNIFYFLTILMANILNQFNLPENFGKILLFFCLLFGLIFKVKIKDLNAASISIFLFIAYAFFSAIHGIDFNYSLPLLLGFLMLYLFVKSYVGSLNQIDLGKVIIYHAYIANAMLVLMLVAYIFFPALIHPAIENYHPYAGLTGVVGTSAAVLLGAFLLNTLAFFYFNSSIEKVTSVIFAFLAVLGILIMNARTTEIVLLQWVGMSYLYMVTSLKDETIKQSIFKFLFLFFPLLLVAIGFVYLFSYAGFDSIIFHQSGEGKGIDLAGRTILWFGSLKFFFTSEYIWTGVGYGNHYYFLELNRSPYLTTHNILLDIAYGTGLIGLCFFVCFLILTLLDVIKQFIATKAALYFFIFLALLLFILQSQGESSLDSLLTTNLYLYFLFYHIAMRSYQDSNL